MCNSERMTNKTSEMRGRGISAFPSKSTRKDRWSDAATSCIAIAQNHKKKTTWEAAARSGTPAVARQRWRVEAGVEG